MRRLLAVLALLLLPGCAPVAVAPEPSAAPSATGEPTSTPWPSVPPVSSPSATPTVEPTSTAPADPCGAPVVCTTADSTAVLTIKTPGVFDGRGHHVPNIVVQASNVTVENFVVSEGAQTGILSVGANNVIQDNDISAIHYGTDDLDAMRFFGNNVRILHNRIHNLASGPIKDAHPDCVQSWASKSTGTSSDVEIGWNTCNPGDTQGHGQCIMAEGPGSTDGGGGATGTSARWNIHDNVCTTSANQSISLRDIDDVTVVGNTFSGANAKAVQIVDGSTGVTFSGNVLGPNVGALSGD